MCVREGGCEWCSSFLLWPACFDSPPGDDGKVQELLKTTTYQRLLDCFVFLFCGWVWVGVGGGCFRVWISVIKLWFSSGMTGSCGSVRFGSDAATCSWCCWGELLLLNDVCLRTWPGDGWRGVDVGGGFHGVRSLFEFMIIHSGDVPLSTTTEPKGSARERSPWGSLHLHNTDRAD